MKLDDNKQYILDFVFTISSNSYTVYVKKSDIVLFTFIDESLTHNRDLTHFKRTIIDNNITKTYIFDYYKIVFFLTEKRTSYIKKIYKDLISLDKPKILTLDLETRVVEDNSMIPLSMSIYDGNKCFSTLFSKDC